MEIVMLDGGDCGDGGGSGQGGNAEHDESEVSKR
jgi:hypothetical protein